MAFSLKRRRHDREGPRDGPAPTIASGRDAHAAARAFGGATHAAGANGSNGSAQNPTGDRRIRNAGRWPLRVTDFYLDEPYEQPPVDYLEIFYVRSGSFLHESDAGRQTQRDGAAIISHPRNRHLLKHVENCHLTRVRFLPEWLTPDFPRLLTAEFALSAMFSKSWFHLPDRDSIHVFDTRPERRAHLVSELELMRSLLEEANHREPTGDEQALLRASLVSFLLQIGAEFGTFLRHRGGLVLPDKCRAFLLRMESLLVNDASPGSFEGIGYVAANEQNTSAGEEPGDDEHGDFAARFRHVIGLTMEDYLLQRRVDHAAYRLLTSEQRTGKIATALGFADAAALTLKFEARYRVSPAVYRQKFCASSANGNGKG